MGCCGLTLYATTILAGIFTLVCHYILCLQSISKDASIWHMILVYPTVGLLIYISIRCSHSNIHECDKWQRHHIRRENLHLH